MSNRDRAVPRQVRRPVRLHKGLGSHLLGAQFDWFLRYYLGFFLQPSLVVSKAVYFFFWGNGPWDSLGLFFLGNRQSGTLCRFNCGLARLLRHPISCSTTPLCSCMIHGHLFQEKGKKTRPSKYNDNPELLFDIRLDFFLKERQVTSMAINYPDSKTKGSKKDTAV